MMSPTIAWLRLRSYAAVKPWRSDKLFLSFEFLAVTTRYHSRRICRAQLFER